MQVRKFPKRAIWQTALFVTLSLITNNSFASQTDFQKANNGGAKSRIIASFYQENGQQKLIGGLEVVIDNGWKIYAPDNSGFGVPPSFNFANSKNIDVEKFNPIFPKAHLEKEQIGNDVIQYSTYKEKVIIPLELAVIDANQSTNLEIEVNYGLCKEICIPVSQKFSLKIPALENDSGTLKNIQQYLENKQIVNAQSQDNSTSIDSSIPKISLLKALLIAFIGGAILNIMPCVLPVLSIKLLSIIDHSGAKVNRIRWAFLSTILGIVFSFSIFAVVTVFLKSIGNQIGWGFQFQNPYFLLFLLAVLMVFIANLLGLFEFNFHNFLANILNRKIGREEKKKNIFIPNFFSGILAVLLATPCSAPFVGVAISFALSAQMKETFLIFGSMSLGLSLPYLILIFFPKTVKSIPKAGAWMIRIKNLMAGFLVATAIWLVYILIDNIGFIAAMSAAILAILILLFFKIANKSYFSRLPHKLRFLTMTLAFSAIISAIFIVPNRLAYLNKMTEKAQQEHWIKFDQSQIPELVKQGKTVVIDITADWCITCQANKLLVLSSKEVKGKLSQNDIIAMRGDLTKPDETIFNFMKKYNRYGIPFNIVFGPSAPDGILTSELPSKESLLEAIDKASQK